MTKISEDKIAAFVDGELSADEAALVQRAETEDAEIAALIERYRALRAEIDESFGSIMGSPPPARLANLLRSHVRSDRRRRSQTPKSASRRSGISFFVGGSLAASLAVGFLLGALTMPRLGGDSALQLAVDNAQSLDQLAGRLEYSPSSGEAGGGIAVTASFESAERLICRSFLIGDNERLKGLACRHGLEDWRIVQLAPAPPTDAYALAGADESFLEALGANYVQISIEQEQRLLKNSWIKETLPAPAN
jgi:hypothetical protein